MIFSFKKHLQNKLLKSSAATTAPVGCKRFSHWRDSTPNLQYKPLDQPGSSSTPLQTQRGRHQLSFFFTQPKMEIPYLIDKQVVY
jgi:hypothetical protein